MTTFSHPFGNYNVTSSINYFLKNNLGLSVPSWMVWNYGTSQPRTLTFDYPDQPLSFPSFSVTHHSSDTLMHFEGDRADGSYKGIRRHGMMEINCWVLEIQVSDDGSQIKNYQWMHQLRDMRDMVFLLFQKNKFIDLYNFTDPLSPTALTAIAEIKDMRETTVLPDPNPAVKRIRILVTYDWTERWT